MRGVGICLLFVGALLATPVAAQHNPARAQQLLARADTLRVQGDSRAAAVAYERALDADRSLVEAYLQLARFDVYDQAWRRAGNRLDAVLKREPGHLDAHVLRGVVHRELGRHRTPLRVVKERLNWRSAERHFETVLAADSAFQDVLYQYALLEQYRGRWERAFVLARRQVALNPGTDAAMLGLFKLYWTYVIDKGTGAEALLARQPDELATFFQAELLRREGDLPEAEALLTDLLGRRLMIPRAPVRLALARIYVARGEAAAAETQFWSAVDGIRSRREALFVFEDAKYILTREEVERFGRLHEADALQAFFQGVWARRNPTPAAATNVRLLEHYRRLLRSDEVYAQYRPKTFFNNPDRYAELDLGVVHGLNAEYNDRGLIYIRHGEPDDRVITIESEADDLYTTRRIGSVQEPLTVESWRYYATPEREEMIVHFSSLGGNSWRLVPAVTTLQAMLDRIDWGPLYNPHRIEPHRRVEMREETQAAIDLALASDRHTWPGDVAPLEVRPLVASFRGPDGQADVSVYVAFPISAVAEEADGRSDVLVEVGAAVHDPAWQLVGRQQEELMLRLPARGGNISIGQFAFTVRPDSYHVAVHVRPEGTSLLGGERLDVAVPDYTRPRLAMSDVLPASVLEPAVGEGAYVRRGYRVVPNPTLAFPARRPIRLYFEIYNLLLGDEDQTHYRVTYTLTADKRRGLLGRLLGRGTRTALSVSSPAEGQEVSPAEVAELDVARVAPGAYELTVTVRDERSGAETARTLPIILFE